MTKILAFILVSALSTFAQVIPESAQALLYFPHLADGGPPSQRWQTILTFTNPNPNSATVLIEFLRDNGGALNIDFGSGPSSQFSFVIPANGSRIFRSQVSSQITTQGWAVAAASLPVQGTVAFLEITNGVPQVEITANSTLPTLQYSSAANPKLSIAVANPSAASRSIRVVAVSSEGALAGQQTVIVPPDGHISFTLIQELPGLAGNFSGTVMLTGNTAQDYFVAWTLNSDASTGTLSSLPDGRLSLPISQYDRVWRAFERVLASAQTNFSAFGLQPVNLQVLGGPTINAFASGNTVTVYLALAELISDSESELGFVIAHELGHVYQFRLGGVLPFYPSDKEFDADIFGAIAALGAGYDPYGAAGALAKAAMVTGQAGLVIQIDNQLAADAHKSYNERLSNVFNTLALVCSQAQTLCTQYKSIFHPDFPVQAPLLVEH